MGNVKEINIKNHTYWFFNDIVSIEDFDSNLPKVDKKSQKNIDIYYILYSFYDITRKSFSDYNSINSKSFVFYYW